MEKGLLDDLSFEDLITAYENKGEKGIKDENKGGMIKQPEMIRLKNRETKCRFCDYNACNDRCQYFSVCGNDGMVDFKIDETKFKDDKSIYLEEYFEWLEKARFHERVIRLYKHYACDDDGFAANSESELLDYIKNCVKKYSGQKKNFYKYYVQFIRQKKSRD